MAAYVPQVYKTWKTKSARSVSMLMFLICAMGDALWIVCGLATNKPAIYITTIVIFILASFPNYSKDKIRHAK
jgi:MtN3 and saliva related transmembrane protein